MMYTEINPREHSIILNSVEKYIESRRLQLSSNPQEALFQRNLYRDELYSEIAVYMPTYAYYVLTHINDNDPCAEGISFALINHMQDPAFVDIVLQYLNRLNDTDAPKQRALVGALFIVMVTKYFSTISPSSDDTKKKDKKNDKNEELTKAEQDAINVMEPARIAAANLLGGITKNIKNVCPELSDENAMFVAGSMLIGGEECIKNIYEMNMPITADVFNIVINDVDTFESILAGALLLEEAGFTKTGTNQKAFVDSLKRWVYKTLNMVTDPIKLHQFIVRVYGTQQPNVQTKLIKPNECGPTYGYLLNVVKHMIVDTK